MTTEVQQNQVLRDVSWRDLFAWVHLFRTFRIAIHPSKLALAWLLLLLLYLGGRTLDLIWTYIAPTPHNTGIFISFFQFEVAQVAQVVKSVLDWNWLGFDGVLQSVINFLIAGPATFFSSHPVYATIFTLWFLLLWAIFGGAVARIAAVHAARDEKMSVRQALRFSSGKMLSFIFAPIIPLLLILAGAALLAAGGWILLHIPYAGPILLGIFFFLALLIGGVLALLVIGTGAGFNLMYPTIAVEGSDSFDAISRSFSYVYHRPWKLLWYTVLAIAYGAICYLFVRFFIYLMLALTQYFIGWFLPTQTQAATYWPVMWPPITFWSLTYTIPFRDLKFSDDVAAWFIAFWVYFTISMLGAFVISFYFSANTIIYGLLRRDVDATDLDDVYVEEIEEEFSEAPPVAPEKVSPAIGPIAGPPVVPPPGGEPRAATSADLSPTHGAGMPADPGSAKVHPTASTPGGEEFVKPDVPPDNLIRPKQDPPAPDGGALPPTP